MQVLQIIYYLHLSFFYLTNDVIFALLTDVPPCLLPYSHEKCVGFVNEAYSCRIHPMSRVRYLKCDHSSYSRILVLSDNLLLLYPPFIEIFLDQFGLGIFNKLQLFFLMYPNQSVYDIDLRPLNQIQSPINLTLYTHVSSRPTHIVFRTYTWFKRAFYESLSDRFHWGIASKWETTQKNNSMKNDDIVCYRFTMKETNSTDIDPYDLDYTCPSDQCSTNKNDTRLCLGSTACLYVASDTILCRIDQLRSSDRFNLNTTFLYKDLIITTSDTHKQTLHTFSTHLLNSCIVERLVIIVIHGRLAIPSLNSTSFFCPNGLV